MNWAHQNSGFQSAADAQTDDDKNSKVAAWLGCQEKPRAEESRSFEDVIVRERSEWIFLSGDPEASSIQNGLSDIAPCHLKERAKHLFEVLLSELQENDPQTRVQRAFHDFESLKAILKLPHTELATLFGPKIATLMSASIALVEIAIEESYLSRRQVRSRADLVLLAGAKLGFERAERFCVFYFDLQRRLIKSSIVGIGDINCSTIDVRAIAIEALQCGASSLAVVHNHPSGNPTPSKPDKRIAFKIEKTFNTLGIEVLDQIVIGDGVGCSIRDGSETILRFAL